MIVKSLGRKGSGAVGRSLEYVSRQEAVLKNEQGETIVFKHNVFGNNLEQIKKEFLLTNERRIHKRSDGNSIMHTTLSFSPKSTEFLNVEVLEKLTRDFYRLSNPNALYYATVHKDKEHVHVHIVASATDLEGRSTRISTERFEQVKLELQESQSEFLGLEDSIVNHGAKEHERGEAGYWEKQRKTPRQHEIREAVLSSFELAQNREEFFELLERDGLSTYKRGGAIAGIEDNRHYRFKTLGVDLEDLDMREARLKELENIGEEQMKEQESEEKQQEEMTDEERERMDELNGLLER